MEVSFGILLLNSQKKSRGALLAMQHGTWKGRTASLHTTAKGKGFQRRWCHTAAPPTPAAQGHTGGALPAQAGRGDLPGGHGQSLGPLLPESGLKISTTFLSTVIKYLHKRLWNAQ